MICSQMFFRSFLIRKETFSWNGSNLCPGVGLADPRIGAASERRQLKWQYRRNPTRCRESMDLNVLLASPILLGGHSATNNCQQHQLVPPVSLPVSAANWSGNITGYQLMLLLLDFFNSQFNICHENKSNLARISRYIQMDLLSLDHCQSKSQLKPLTLHCTPVTWALLWVEYDLAQVRKKTIDRNLTTTSAGGYKTKSVVNMLKYLKRTNIKL